MEHSEVDRSVGSRSQVRRGLPKSGSNQPLDGAVGLELRIDNGV